MVGGTETGVATPHTAASLRPLNLSYGDIEHILLVPTSLFFNFSQLKDQFTATLPDALTADKAQLRDAPSTPTELLAAFLGYTASVVEHGEPGPFDEVLTLILNEFEARYLRGNNVHAVAINLNNSNASSEDPESEDQQNALPVATPSASRAKRIVKWYYAARAAADRPIKSYESALLRAVSDEKASIFAVFSGQGKIEMFEELRETYNIYTDMISDYIELLAGKLLSLSRTHPDAKKTYFKGLDIMQWLNNPETTPDLDYLVTAPVSVPIVGIIQLAHYAITAQVLGITPGELRAYIGATTGHSQGIISSLVIAAADDWPTFYELSVKAVTLLFYIGLRVQQQYPKTSLPPAILKDSVAENEGTPSPMLIVSGLSKDEVERHVEETNKHLPKEKQNVISLINGPRFIVVSGPPQSLYGLNVTLRKFKAEKGANQGRIPHSQRKLDFESRFLSMTVPFHSPLLDEAAELIIEDAKEAGIEWTASSLKIPVIDTLDGKDLRHYTDSIVARCTRLITSYVVDWENTIKAFHSTHILDFGPGGTSGVGTLTQKNVEGTGVRVIFAGILEAESEQADWGYKQEIFDREEDSVKFALDWVKEFSPSVVKTSSGQVFVDTKFSRLLGRPPLMVPGMTPTTVRPEFVAATLNAGYHIELAGGGYFMDKMLVNAFNKIEGLITNGVGISLNVLYVNPVMLQWCIPLIERLRKEGFPVEGLTIGAGVPSVEVANGYIRDLGLKHISFKPGTVDSINTAIDIAAANPNFPVVIQWTGGRGGGHHSFEDFHAPILETYARIRKYHNIILVAGSGFGDAEGSYPYLTGQWSTKFKYPPMPFDGVLMGSRVMVAKEAFTSPAAKQAIVDAPGVPDEQWENSYTKPTGGIITVNSEMGEPIHKLATRGVMLWHELDKTIFSLPRAKRVDALLAKKDYIIKRLNADFQKTWFGKKSNGEVADVDDMTYGEIVERLIELLYVKKESRWIDITLRNFTGDVIRRLEERFTCKSDTLSLLQSYSQLDKPFEFLEQLFERYPESKEQIINAQDKDYFLILCRRPTQKPVPFIPVLDENFDFYFKKDSLWQSEDLAAVVGEDVGRTCILHGPVAAAHSVKVDEPIKEILDNIHQKHIEMLVKDFYGGDKSKIPVVESFGGPKPHSVAGLEAKICTTTSPVSVIKDGHTTSYKISVHASEKYLPSLEDWIALLAGEGYSWRHALLSTKIIVQGSKHQKNVLLNVLAPRAGITVEIEYPDDAAKTVINVYEPINGKLTKVVNIYLHSKDLIKVFLIDERNFDKKPVGLELQYIYKPEVGFAPIQEVMEDRNLRIKNFYWDAWFGTSSTKQMEFDITKPWQGESVTVEAKAISDFVHTVGNTGEAFVARPGKTTYAPMDFAIVTGWKAIIMSIFPKIIDGDLLKLVHLSNGFKMFPGASPLKKGDVASTTAKLNSVLIQPSGKVVEVSGVLTNKNTGENIMEITSKFLYRGNFTDYETTFQNVQEPPMQLELKTPKDVAILKSKEWFHLTNENIDLLGQALIFRLQSFMKYKTSSVYSSVDTTGAVLMELPTKEIIQVAKVEYSAGVSFGNPVIDYLTRNGTTLELPVHFDNPIPLNAGSPLVTRAPTSNEPYAIVSGDFNPIHVSKVFADYAGLPGTITHGMYTSASVRSLVETWAAENKIARVRAFNCSFVGMVLPNDDITTKLEHIGMINGRKIIKVTSTKVETQEAVLIGEAEVEQPTTAFVFTGQGSQEQGMGMDLYDSSEVARKIWDRADKHFLEYYGFSIINIVRNNPKELTIHFGGAQGAAIRENYISMLFEYIGEDGTTKVEKIFKDITEDTDSYTFQSPTGLLSATQFTQPALTLMEKASFEDMKSRGLVDSNSLFAGHSLGEYSALSSLADIMPVENLIDVVFYRGMTMQVAVPRDSLGRSNYGMAAVNPSRISKTFNDAALRFVIEHIAEQTGWLLEIVNYNVENQQYVTAGDLRGLDTLTNVLNVIKLQSINVDKLLETMPVEKVKGHLSEIVTEVAAKSVAKPQPIDLERGFACIPLKGISVPFHSSYLRSGVKPFHNFLAKKIPMSAIKPASLIDKYIPNLTASPFKITKEYFQEVYELTKSERIKNIIDNWETYESS